MGPTIIHTSNADHGPASSYIKGEPCRLVSWDADVPLQNHLRSIAYKALVTTFWTSLATTRTNLASFYAPLRAHFEPTKLGKRLIDAGIAVAPTVQIEDSVYFAKDADGHLTGSLLTH